MKRLTTKDQPLLHEWFSAAINDREVSIWLNADGYNREPTIPDTDWEKVYYLDETNSALLTVHFSPKDKVSTLAVYILNTPNRLKASFRMFRFIKSLPSIHDIEYFSLSISSKNTKWLHSIQRRYLQYQWGVEPHAFYHAATRSWVDAHKFKIPTQTQTQSQ